MIGQTLLHYRITDRLGAGGMGEVYRARDEKLNRDVALKVLPERALSDDKARKRFRKEAHALSQLSHPHIATIHDFDTTEGVDVLVMELVSGPSLRDEIEAKGALPEQAVIRLGAQLARALQAAHEKGIVHRDLKPSNLQLTEDGLLKVLDFGLARLLPQGSGEGNGSAETQTALGRVAGTLPYMSPEQVRGQELDARTDLYAAGAVLYEMATGRRPFSKGNAAELTAAILNEEPAPPRTVNDRLSPGLEAVILKALDKDPELRCQTAKDLRVDLERLLHRSGSGIAPVSTGLRAGEAEATQPEQRRRRRARERLAWTTLASILGGLAAFFAWHLTREPEPTRVVRFGLDVPRGVMAHENVDLAMSPDGRKLAMAPWNLSGSIWLRSFDTFGTRRLPGTERGSSPFWSPDGASLAFFASGDRGGLLLRRVELANGAVETICAVPGRAWGGGSWNDAGQIIFSAGGAEDGFRIHAVSATGGEPTVLLELDEGGEERGHHWPQFLPDGRRFLFSVDSPRDGVRGTWLSDLDRPHERRLVIPGVMFADYTAPGYLLYAQEGRLVAQPFDATRAEPAGEPTTLAADAWTGVAWDVGETGSFSASANGLLVYAKTEDSDSELVWFDRSGGRVGTVGQPNPYRQVQLSPDGQRVVAEIDQEGNQDLWLLEVNRGVATRATPDSAQEHDAVWSPDGRELFFTSDRGSDGTMRLHRKRLDTSEPASLLLDTRVSAWSESVSPDGATLVYLPSPNESIWALPLGSPGKPELLVKADYTFDEPQVSPDGHWLAYGAQETGEWEVYVMPFRRKGERRRVSPAGGRQPRWRGDGQELFYLTPEGQLVAVEVEESGDGLRLGLPRELFNARVLSPWEDEYCVSRDGNRFLVIVPLETSRWSPNVILNWPSLLN